MISAKLNKPLELSFKLNIEGSEVTPKARLMLSLKEGQQLSIVGSVVGDRATVSIPALQPFKEMIAGSTLNAQLEVYIQENYFIPWEGQISIEQPLVVKAEAVEPIQETTKKPMTVIEVTSNEPEPDEVEPEQEEQEPEPEPEIELKPEPIVDRKKPVASVKAETTFAEKIRMKSNVTLNKGFSKYESTILERGDTILVYPSSKVTDKLIQQKQKAGSQYVIVKEEIELKKEEVILEVGDLVEIYIPM